MQRGQEPGAGTGRAGSGNGDAPGAGTGTCRGKSAGAGTGAETGQRGRKAAGERAPEVTENDVVRPRKGSIPVRQCPRAACSPATPLRQLPPPLRRDATPSRYPLPPLAPHLCKLPLACTTTRPVSAPLSPLLLFRKGRRGPPQGRAPAPIVPNTHNQPIAPNTHNRPIARTRTKKERHPLPDAAPWNGCAVSTRGRRPYRPLRAGRRTRPAYWPQSTPR